MMSVGLGCVVLMLVGMNCFCSVSVVMIVFSVLVVFSVWLVVFFVELYGVWVNSVLSVWFFVVLLFGVVVLCRFM